MCQLRIDTDVNKVRELFRICAKHSIADMPDLQGRCIVCAYDTIRKAAGVETIQIRFDGPPGPVAGRFVEVEDVNGKSISIGEWVQDGEYWLLVIPGRVVRGGKDAE